MGCVFCEIVVGVRTAHHVLDEASCVGFLDQRPLFAGHVLLVPRAHHETLVDLPEDMVQPLFTAARRIARAVQEALGADGTFVAINNKVSQSVPHLHVHIVPRKTKDGLRGFFWPRQKYADDDDAARVATLIRHALTGT